MIDGMPDNCILCGLCRAAKSYKIPMEVHRPEGAPPWDPIDLHIVAEFPKSQEDHEGKPFVGIEGQFVREFLSCWEGSYAISYLARCSPPEGRGPTVEEIAACEPFLSEDFSNTTPKCIMLLGGAALKAVWKNGPTSVAKARMSPVKLGNTWIVTTYAPGMHTSGKQDLTQEYVRAFEMASKIVQGQFREHNPDVREVRSSEDLGIVLRQIASSPLVCVDIETDTHDKVPSKQTIYMPDAKLICMAIGTTPEEPVWVLPAKMINRQILASFYGKTLVGHNIKYDVNALAWWYDRDLWDHVSIEDTMLMHSSLDQGKAGNGLVDLCIRYLGIPNWKQPVWAMRDAEDERLKRSKLPMTATLADIPFPVVVEMNCKDVAFTMLLHRYLTQNKPARGVYQTLLLPATQFLGAGVELNGIGADPTMQRKILSAVETKIAQIQGMLNEQPEVKRIVNKLSSPYHEVLADGSPVLNAKAVKRVEFNTNSPVHLEHLLAQTDIEVDEKTEKATVWIDGVEVPKSKLDKKNIEKLGEAHPVWRMVWKQREYRNLVSKFLVPYASHIAADGRIHCRYNVCKVEMGGESTGADSQGGGTDTGRLAALDPAMHNLKKDEILRMMFNPAPGFLVAEYDYGQIEPRIMAWLAGCQSLIDACSESDLYRAMSAVMKGKRIVEVTDEERNLMKVGVLAALLYGQQVENFSRQQKVPLHEAQEFFKTARKRFPEVPEYQQDVIRRARAGEEIPTVWGRVSTFGEMYREVRSFGDEMYNQHIDIKAVNSTVQGPASDNTLFQGIRAYRIYRNKNFRFINLVHDSHWAEIPVKTAEHFLMCHKNLMEDTSQFPFEMPVPTPVEVKVGRHLGAMVKWKPGEKVVV